MTNKPYTLYIVGPTLMSPSAVTVSDEDEDFYYVEVIKGVLFHINKRADGYRYFKEREAAFKCIIDRLNAKIAIADNKANSLRDELRDVIKERDK